MNTTNNNPAFWVYTSDLASECFSSVCTNSQTSDTEDITELLDTPDFTMGKLMVIKGTEVSFFIPPTGIEVVKDEDGNYVRNAVTLERLEHCIRLDENGTKTFDTGPDVVFPKPTETFIKKDGTRKFRAIELNEKSGLYIKVIAPYTEDGTDYKVGDELFITGKEQAIYFPREEHAIVKYGDQQIHYATAIPPGEGRYVLNRLSGEIELVRGPDMLLPDPRTRQSRSRLPARASNATRSSSVSAAAKKSAGPPIRKLV